MPQGCVLPSVDRVISARIHHPTSRGAVVALLGALLTLAACGDGTGAVPAATPGRPPAHERSAAPESARLDRVGLEPGRLDTGRVDVARLEPDLRAALEEAARAAEADGVVIEVTSGWRSWEHQERLLDEAVAKYGSLDEALEYVSTPEASAHVTGDAVDIGPAEAAGWLNRHGSAYGLCQIFANEDWHFELATTPGGDCPPMYADASAR